MVFSFISTRFKRPPEAGSFGLPRIEAVLFLGNYRKLLNLRLVQICTSRA